MKRNLSSIALAIALAYAATPALAATSASIDQNGNANEGYIEQQSTAGTTDATLTQTGDNNRAGLPNVPGFPGTAGLVTAADGGIYQGNSTDVTAAVTQDGNERAFVWQQNVTVGSATVNQTGVGGSNQAYVSQLTGTDFSATINQSGGANQAVAYQHNGSNLTATITQSGNSNDGVPLGVSGFVQGYGLANVGAAIEQTGTYNVADIQQVSNDNSAKITQSGAGASGLENTAFIYQAGAGGFTGNIAQAGGANNHAGIYQY